MKLHLLLATILSLPCLALVGCGNASSPTSTTTEVSTEPVSASDLAEAKAEMERVNNEELAVQNQDAPAK